MQGKATFWAGIALTFGAIAAILTYWQLELDLPHGFALLLILFAAGIGLATYGLLRSRLAQLEAARSSSFRDLKESESRFEQLFQASPFPAIVTRLPDGKVLAANESAAQRFGTQPASGLDLFAVDFHVDPAQRDIVTNRIRTDGHFEDQLLHLKTLTGEAFWASVSARGITYDGQPSTLSYQIQLIMDPKTDEAQQQRVLLQIANSSIALK